MRTILPILVVLSVFACSCKEKGAASVKDPAPPALSPSSIPDTMVEASLVQYNRQTSVWSYNDRPFSGYVINHYPNQALKEKTGILNGRKENQAMSWYEDGQLKQVSTYYQGKLHGPKKRWSVDSAYVLVSHLNYYLGKPHGEQKQWYPTGELFKRLNLNMGKEEGIQQAYRTNGALFANYEAKNGRIFGLKRASLCFSLEDENIQYRK